MSDLLAGGAAEALGCALAGAPLTRHQILSLLALPGGEAGERLFQAADTVRRQEVGDAVFLRGIIEFSNVCERNCLYCGLRKSNRQLTRYRMPDADIIAAARQIREAGIGTVVLQSGEDPLYTPERLCPLVSRIAGETGLAITLSVGERPAADYAAFREAGAERYLLKHETSDADLFGRLRPGTSLADRLACLATLAGLGYEVGTGNMVGLPDQTPEMLADDLLLMRDIGADMLGIGPFLPHPQTPLADRAAGDLYLTLKVLAVARLLTRSTHIPATTALGVLDGRGRIKALQAGANVVMPDFTPPSFRQHYEIYPGRSDRQNVQDFLRRLEADIGRSGRTIGLGKGGRIQPERVKI